MDVFSAADILVPQRVDMEKWSVIACDQYSSQRDYWRRVRDFVGGEPSTLNMIMPEAYLEELDEERCAADIGAAMESYLERGLLREIGDSFVLVERTLHNGQVRRGLVGAVDLEEYSFSGGEASIVASEGTVLDRLPARIRARRASPLEAPHILAFIDDAADSVIGPLADRPLPALYDFDLMEGGGHIRGAQVSGDDALGVAGRMRVLREKSRVLMVVGDGNHSLAAAKVYWDELKQGLGEIERERHPARRALLEVNNVYDSAIGFEAIHRVVFDVDVAEFLREVEGAVPGGSDYEMRWAAGGGSGAIGVGAAGIGEAIAAVQEFLDAWAAGSGCRVDYIHGSDVAERLASEERCVALLMPSMGKSDLFETVSRGGVFPKKSFSVGVAGDKRYYLECRAIK